jgi:hypothetical protein
MANLKLNRLALVLSIAIFLCGERGFGDIRINYDIELSDQEKIETAHAPEKLISNASHLLRMSFGAADGDAWVIDKRDEPRNQYPLMMLVHYPTIKVNDYRTFRPAVVCEGTYNPVVWEYCVESSDTFLDIPGHRQIHIGHASITAKSAQEMLAFVDAAKLETPSGSQIAARDVHNVLYNTNVGLYHIIGITPDDEYFSINLRPIEKEGAATFEISDWSCR